MKLGSPEALRQEPSLHDWRYEEAAAMQEAKELAEEAESRAEALAEYPAHKKQQEQEECPHDENDHGICLDCGKDIWDDIVASAEFRADCLEDR